MTKLFSIMLVMVVVTIFLLPTSLQAQPEEARCQFPSAWDIQTDPLTVIDEGRTDAALLEEYNGEGDNFHPFGLMGDPFIMVEDSTFRMWFTSAYETEDGREITGFAYTESRDGLVWDDPKHEAPYVLVDIVLGSTADEWDHGGIETNAVVFHPETEQYYMFYAGIYDQEAYDIGMATSDDGLNWTKHPEPVLSAVYDWEQPVIDPRGVLVGGVLEPTVLFDEETGTFQMWYSTLGIMDGAWGGRIGYATSTDGIHWDRLPEPVFSESDAADWDGLLVSHSHVMADPDAGYHLFYAGASTDEEIFAIGHAYSPDGITWTRNPNNPIINNDADTWRSSMAGGPSALFHDDQIYLYYMGARNRDFAFVHFGLATASCE